MFREKKGKIFEMVFFHPPFSNMKHLAKLLEKVKYKGLKAGMI